MGIKVCNSEPRTAGNTQRSNVASAVRGNQDPTGVLILEEGNEVQTGVIVGKFKQVHLEHEMPLVLRLGPVVLPVGEESGETSVNQVEKHNDDQVDDCRGYLQG